MKAFWTWLFSLFGIKPASIPPEVIDETTANVEPDDFISDEEIEELLDDDISDELEDLVDTTKRKASKFAVIIGINKYDPTLNANLNGCVNDAEQMYKILTEDYDFPPDNIRMLTDFRATSDNIFERIEWLLSHDISGDELFLHYSGHGSQIRDRNNDELEDQLDEIICPSDLDWDDPFTDDLISGLFKNKADGVFLTFVCDACHSGSMSKSLSFTELSDHTPKERYIKPPIDILIRSNNLSLPVNKIGKALEKDQDHVLLSGCRDDQTSADAYIKGIWQGALSYSLMRAMKENPNANWATIHAEIISILNAGGYSQRPQLSGNDDLIKGRTILGK